MKKEEVEEIRYCLGSERRKFWYFKNRYCFDMVGFWMESQGREQVNVSELKNSAMARFLQKPEWLNVLAGCGNGQISLDALSMMVPAEQLPFTISLARWGDGDEGWDQTSRNQCNLVLQLNFDAGHTRRYQRLIRPDASYGPFEFWSHPVCTSGKKTLAWVRMDIDMTRDEVLIEEVQSDWIRNADSVMRMVKRTLRRQPEAKPNDVCSDMEGSFYALCQYVENELKPYRDIWAEAALLAAIHFIVNELGVSTIYYHTFHTGKKLKMVDGDPPKSIYSALPKQFGFTLTETVPTMLSQHRVSRRRLKTIPSPKWYRCQL